MRRFLSSLFALAWIAALGAPASAVETADATDFDGTYEIIYTGVGFQLYLCVNGQCLEVFVPAAGNEVTQADVDALRLELETACDANIDPAVCDWIVDPAVGAIVWWVVMVANQLPETAVVEVDPDPIMFFWWSTGLHGSTWDTYSDVQDTITLAYTGETYEGWFGAMLDNNDGVNNGNFYAVGLAVGAPFGGGGIACMPAGAAGFASNSDRDAEFALDGAFAVNVGIACLLSDGVHWAVVNIGASEAAAFEGTKVE